MSVFEITLTGFNGASDDTDDRILWVIADSLLHVTQALEGLRRLYQAIEPVGLPAAQCDGLIDAVLPTQIAHLRQLVQRTSGDPNG